MDIENNETLEEAREPTLRGRVIKELEDRRNRLLSGQINTIPSPFKRFSNDFIGIEQSTYYCVTSFTKGAKSQFTSYVFIYHALMYAYHSNDPTLKVTIFYFPLEETPSRIMQRFMSYLLYELSGGKIRISPRDLRSSRNELPLSQDILDILKSEEYQDILKFFEDNIHFETETNPTGIYKVCKRYAEEHGTVHYKEKKYKDEAGRLQTIQGFDYYTSDNPNEYKLIVIDTMNLVDIERGMTLKQSMDKLSEYLAKYLRNRYGFSPVVIQQQAMDGEGIDNIKLNKVRPSLAGLGDSKYIARDANIVLGLFSPARLGLAEYEKYDITQFKDNIRFLEVCANRDAEMGGLIALFFDGAVCQFKELPKPSDTTELAKVYKYLKKLREQPKTEVTQTSTFFNLSSRQSYSKWEIFISKIKNKLINLINKL